MTVLTTPDHQREYLTVAEVAERLRCSEPTVRRRIRAGDLAAVRLGEGRAIRVSRAAVADLLEPIAPDGVA
jgi:excisionase family DNA binding protein